MRIRKRKVPLPFHLLSPVPIPAPSFFSSPDPDPTAAATTPLVQLRHGASATRPPIPASDDNKAAAAAAVCCGGGAAGPTVRSGGIGPAHPIYPVTISWKDEKEEFGINANNVAAAARKGSKCSSRSSNADPEMLRQQRQPAAASASHLPPVSSWCQDVKNDDANNKLSPFFPSRKRSSWSSSPSSSSSASSYFDIGPSNGQQGDKTRGDTKVVHAADHHISGIGDGVNSSNDKKKRSSGGGGGRGGGGVVMEGSRCSRVNGRGWRCSQPTLVGYSLCEHHLGKGRMRSITAAASSNLRPPRQLGTTSNSTTTVAAPKAIVHPLHVGAVVLPSSGSSYTYGVDDDEEEEEEEKKQQQQESQFVFPASKKKSKLGAVKARSISSLLDQPDNSSNAAAAVVQQPASGS